ncbi:MULTISPECIES: hypothetical protein [Arthrobacter]|uniref:DUF3040 domain-containing protein n=1 Tax=Arthrobacter bambusae TaxID=1338426 RepID=A0AAW8D6M3_9MICC|nr:hypothetical protein [Arthrobacter bambusae]MDP9903350.1 hypothetical protein [Arthrobacter bambusae]MDQ0128656.1 hypothetical protein [Arthrobacter bambusae]MDQ0179997.1 hypothetical protein [Arthrobacter bambusae]
MAGDIPADVIDEDAHELQAGVVLSITPRQEKAMETMQSTATALPEVSAGAGERRDAASDAAVFKVRYGRCALALGGLLLLLTAAVSGVLRILGLVSGWLPLASIVGVVGTVFLLRRLAIRDRRAKMNRAFRNAMGPAVESPRESAPASDRPATKIFDAEAHAREATRLTAVELRQAALNVAVAAGDNTVRFTAESKESEWRPVDVPKPTYVDAAKAPRPAPEPLDLPEAPKPLGKPTLKPASAPSAGPSVQVQHGKPQSALSNLDDVLQRRRA